MSGIKIVLPTNRYEIGQTVTGKLVCNFRSEKECRKIYICFKCHEETSWTDTETYYDNESKSTKTRTITCTGSNMLFYKQVIVHRAGTITAGNYTFPFSFDIPNNLPESYDCSYGNIQYIVESIMDRPFKFDFSDTEIIHVRSPIRLEYLHNDLREPGEWADEKTVCCFCCASGPVELEVYLKKRAFIVGEKFNVRVYCKNMSNINVEELNLKIKQEISYKTTNPDRSKYSDYNIAELEETGVGAHGDREYNITMEIPRNTVIHNFESCSLFSSWTTFKVSAVLEGCHSDLELYPQIALGHIPFVTDISDQNMSSAPPPFYPVPDPSQGMPMPMPMPLPPYSDLPHPSNGNVPAPSAPVNPTVPSAPPKGALATDNSTIEEDDFVLPPPSYSEATKNLSNPSEDKKSPI